VSPVAGSGPRWLDALAKWVARAPATPAEPAVPADDRRGVSRRTALRGALGAGLLAAGPLALLDPTPAGADANALMQCLQASDAQAFTDFQACVKDPLAAFAAYKQAIDTAQNKLQTATGKSRKRLLGIIDRSTKGLGRTVHTLEGCNLQWQADRGYGAEKCKEANPPTPPSGGGGAPPSGPVSSPPSTFCTPQYEIQCGNICCNATGAPECCFCSRTGMYQCCANGSNCTCCGR
jgi:hypothetical protein